MSTAIAKRQEALVKRVARRVAKESPRLADLAPEELEKLARVVVAEELRDELKARVKLERIDYQAERDTFLSRASRTDSVHTALAYRSALSRLESWCKVQGFSPLELTPARADDWIESEKAGDRAPASVRLAIAAASAFWTWLERRHAELARNPFRGTKARPPRKTRRELAVPSDHEVRLLEAQASPELRAAIVFMAQGGLRVGALPSLSINGSRWTAESKGKELAGKIPEEAREAVKKAGLSLRRPFEGQSAQRIADRFRYLVEKLFKAGELRGRYSVHDLRHAFAVRLYQNTKDIYQVEKALHHASVGVTESYLRSLGLEA